MTCSTSRITSALHKRSSRRTDAVEGSSPAGDSRNFHHGPEPGFDGSETTAVLQRVAALPLWPSRATSSANDTIASEAASGITEIEAFLALQPDAALAHA
jgi:hypothetical protein